MNRRTKKLHINQQTILELCGKKQNFFLIPDYQRPYEWGNDECQQLWDDLYGFAMPNDNHKEFMKDDEYFLGPIVMFENNERDGKYEIIDGQQRLTTLMLLLRAFYTDIEALKDEDSIKVRELIEQCIYKTDEIDKPQKDILKIDSEVATENDKEEFFSILKSGSINEKMKSKYAYTYKFFLEKIADITKKALYTPYLQLRILRNCIILPIIAESQDTALRIFSTLNDRGKPLSDTDIFKAKFYKYFLNNGKKDEFIKRWKDLENISKEIFAVTDGAPMDELFTRYMYYKRAKKKISNTTVEGLRKFYEKNNYELLCSEDTFNDLEFLADFWLKIYRQDDCFSKRILQKLFVLKYSPNSMWTYLVTTYFFKYKNKNNELDEKDFCFFLDKIIAFIFGYSLIKPGISALKIPVFAELVNIINNSQIDCVKIFSQSDYLSMFIEGSYNIDQQIGNLCIWGRHNRVAERKIKIFKIPLSWIYKFLFKVERTKILYKEKINQIPPINAKPHEESLFRVRVNGNLNSNDIDVQMKDLK